MRGNSMSNIFESIERFNKQVVGVDRSELSLLEPLENSWLLAALEEEITEYAQASDDGDLVKCVDALIDLIYFAAGGLTRLGLTSSQSQQIFDIVHTANMAKKGGAKKDRAVQSELDAYKPDGWMPPEESIRRVLGI